MTTTNGNIEIVNGINHDGLPVMSVIVKRTYQISHGLPLVRTEKDADIRKTDYYYDGGDPVWSTVQYENDLAAHKSGVDVVVVGKAYGKDNKATQVMSVGVRVANKKKLLTVLGDRRCIYRADAPPRFAEPKPFLEMPIRYDRAYGGADEISNPQMPFYYPRNTQGCGVVMHNTKESVDGLRLPNIEDPEYLLTPDSLLIEDPKRWPELPIPQGIGWLQRSWYPRCALMGAYPAYVDVGYATPEERAGLLPKDHIALAMQRKLPCFQSRFNNGASIGLLLKDISTSETIELRGLNPEGELDFSLPGETPEVGLDIGKGMQALQAKLDTICIRTDELEADLLWRAPLVFEGYSWFPEMTKLVAEVH